MNNGCIDTALRDFIQKQTFRQPSARRHATLSARHLSSVFCRKVEPRFRHPDSPLGCDGHVTESSVVVRDGVHVVALRATGPHSLTQALTTYMHKIRVCIWLHLYTFHTYCKNHLNRICGLPVNLNPMYPATKKTAARATRKPAFCAIVNAPILYAEMTSWPY